MSSLEINTNSINKNNLSEKLIEESKIVQLEIEQPSNINSLDNKKDYYTSIESDFKSKLLYPNNCINTFTFWWMWKILKNAKKVQIKSDNLGRISPNLNAKEFLNEIKPKWYGYYQFKNRYPLFRCVINSNIFNIIKIFILIIIQSIIELITINLFRKILQCFENPEDDKMNKTLNLNVFILLSLNFINIFLYRQSDFQIELVGTKAAIQLDTLIYDKLLQVAIFNKDSFSEGKLVNFIQIDSEKFAEFLSDSPNSLIVPFKVIFYIILLFKYFGPSFLAGFVVLIGIIFLIGITQKKRMKYHKEYMKAKDERMKITTQLFNIIKTIKLYNWEKIFLKKVEEKRKIEVDILIKIAKFSVLINMLYWSANILLSLISIITYNIFNDNMDTANILTAIYIFDSLADPLFMIPEFFTGLLESIVSLKRIQDFMGMKNNDYSQIKYLDSNNENISIKIDNVSFGVDKENSLEQLILLKDISLQINKGEIIAVIGEVGSGKSCLLNAILNNLAVSSKKLSENILLSGSISYVSQNPWILNDTVRNNIIFFNEFDQEKYNKILDICELNPDLNLLSGGDMTEIGEKGANLSGGQKARVAIARALYSNSDIFLFDDPLSALDAYVGMKIFNKVFIEYLKNQNKTIIIVTHALQYISFMDRVIYMNKGSIKFFGTPKEIENKDFYKDIIKSIDNKKNKNDSDTKKDIKDDNDIYKINKSEKDIIRITKDEEQKKGRIKFSVWMTFFMYAGGISYLILTIFTNICWKGSEMYNDYYLANWTSKNLEKKENYKYLFKYSSITIIGILFILWRAILMQKGLVKYNIKMHDALIKKLIYAPVNLFHDTIPRGQILNRLSKDLENGSRLNGCTSGTLRVFFQLLSCVLMCSIFNLYSLIFIPIIFLLEYTIVKFYLVGGRDLNRLEGGSRSPVISVFSETIPGIPCIRALKFENNFKDKFNQRINNFFKVRLFQSGGSGWFGVHLDLISFSLNIIVLTFCLLFRKKFTATDIGLLITYSIKLIQHLYGIMDRITRIEKLLTSVERCDSFTNIVQEKYPILPNDKNINFATKGKIKIENYSVKYRPETPIVLKDINILINPGEKIGVVGRTGSGKSTLCLCLFRILEPFKGKIYIDDIDITSIGLEKLRDSLTVIPQEPTLIEGSLRENVDPGNLYSDLEIKNSLIEVGLENLLNEKGLNYHIVEEANNISIGEKQLLCIARAMLRKSKIILMDEATASIDYKTERLIQESIMKVLKDSTVITIAHRIKTIIKYDRILVLSDGMIKEFDTPENLLKIKNGLFNELYKESAI